MSKRNRMKRINRQDSAFPFRMLQYWLKPFDSGLPCVCGKEAKFSMHCLIDPNRLRDLIKAGKTRQDATDIVWNKALSQQLQGVYTVEHIAYICQQCAFDVLKESVGARTATLAMLPMMLVGELSSVIIGAELISRDDDGKTFAALVPRANNVDEMLERFRGESFAVNLQTG